MKDCCEKWKEWASIAWTWHDIRNVKFCPECGERLEDRWCKCKNTIPREDVIEKNGIFTCKLCDGIVSKPKYHKFTCALNGSCVCGKDKPKKIEKDRQLDASMCDWDDVIDNRIKIAEIIDHINGEAK